MKSQGEDRRDLFLGGKLTTDVYTSASRSPWPHVSLSHSVNISTDGWMWITLSLRAFGPVFFIILSFFTVSARLSLVVQLASFHPSAGSGVHGFMLRVWFYVPACECIYAGVCLFSVCLCVSALPAYSHACFSTCPGLGLNVSLVDWCSLW